MLVKDDFVSVETSFFFTIKKNLLQVFDLDFGKFILVLLLHLPNNIIQFN